MVNMDTEILTQTRTLYNSTVHFIFHPLLAMRRELSAESGDRESIARKAISRLNPTPLHGTLD